MPEKFNPVEKYVLVCVQMAVIYLGIACLILIGWEIYTRYVETGDVVIPFNLNGKHPDVESTARVVTKKDTPEESIPEA